ncbi:unnamed protein product [Lepidochelys kempii]
MQPFPLEISTHFTKQRYCDVTAGSSSPCTQPPPLPRLGAANGSLATAGPPPPWGHGRLGDRLWLPAGIRQPQHLPRAPHHRGAEKPPRGMALDCEYPDPRAPLLWGERHTLLVGAERGPLLPRHPAPGREGGGRQRDPGRGRRHPAGSADPVPPQLQPHHVRLGTRYLRVSRPLAPGRGLGLVCLPGELDEEEDAGQWGSCFVAGWGTTEYGEWGPGPSGGPAGAGGAAGCPGVPGRCSGPAPYEARQDSGGVSSRGAACLQDTQLTRLPPSWV